MKTRVGFFRSLSRCVVCALLVCSSLSAAPGGALAAGKAGKGEKAREDPAVQTLPRGQLHEWREVKLSKAQCREKVIARGSFEGVYEGQQCGDDGSPCEALFRLDSGEEARLDNEHCDPDKLYGPQGRRVLAHFEVRRAWYQFAEPDAHGCAEWMVCVEPPAGAKAAAPEPGPWPGIEGEITKTLPFRDRTGDNTLVLTARETGGDDARSREIFAYLFRKDAGGAARRVWRVYDFEKDCEFFIKADFDESRVEITDLDRDGVSEIWLPYSLNCSNDPTPVKMKIIMYEGGQKHAMRGLSRDPNLPLDESRGVGTMDAAFRSGPAAFRDHARKLWKTIDDDYIQPHLPGR